MRRIAVTLLALILSCTAVQATDWELISKGAVNQVPRLEMLTQGTDTPSVCSAVVFAVTDGTAEAITAAHCVTHVGSSHFDLTVNRKHAEVMVFNNLIDLAIIRYEAKKDVAITFAPRTPPMGAEVAVVGYAFGIKHIAAQFGRVSQPLNDETNAVWLNIDLIFGDSGGAAIDELGRLVGINSRIYSGGMMGQMAHIAAVVPIEDVVDFVESYRKSQARLKK
jgi:S1-C subfamily serine protease